MVLVIGGIVYAAFVSMGKTMQEQIESGQTSSSDVMINDNTAGTASSQSSSEAKGSYQIYEPNKLALANQGQVVLFFDAKWCPECQKANRNFKSQPIPDGLTILSVDYDKYTDLKKKYGITYQHTFVQVDANGNQIKKWSGSFTPAEVEAQVKK